MFDAQWGWCCGLNSINSSIPADATELLGFNEPNHGCAPGQKRAQQSFSNVVAALTVCVLQGRVQHQPLGCRQSVAALRAGSTPVCVCSWDCVPILDTAWARD